MGGGESVGTGVGIGVGSGVGASEGMDEGVLVFTCVHGVETASALLTLAITALAKVPSVKAVLTVEAHSAAVAAPTAVS